MIRTMFTRKNLIAIAIAVFYAVTFVFVGACLDGDTTFVSKKNPIAALGATLGFRAITPGLLGYLCLILIAFYMIVMFTALVYEKRYAVVNGIKSTSKKMVLTYSITVLVCVALSLGFCIFCQRPLTREGLGTMFLFLGQTLGLTTGLFLVLFLLIGAATMLVVNFVNIDKPFKFFDDKNEPVFDDEDLVEANDVLNSFDVEAEADVHGDGGSGSGGSGTGGAGGVGGEGETAVTSNFEIGEREKVFPTLSRIDTEHEGYVIESIEADSVTLEELCERHTIYTKGCKLSIKDFFCECKKRDGKGENEQDRVSDFLQGF